MTQSHLLLCLFIGLLFSACSEDEMPVDMSPAYVGTYSLTAIESDTPLDPDVSGNFETTQLLDKISCASLLLLKEDGAFSWDYITLNQIVNNVMGTTTYSAIECIPFSGSDGSYDVSGQGISFSFDTSISNTNALLDGESISVSINEELAVESNGEIRFQNVFLTLTYEK